VEKEGLVEKEREHFECGRKERVSRALSWTYKERKG